MSTLDNWRAAREYVYVYVPDEHWTVHLLEAAITPPDAGRRWSVRLFRDGVLRETITTDEPRISAARNQMVQWLQEHAIIVSDGGAMSNRTILSWGDMGVRE